MCRPGSAAARWEFEYDPLVDLEKARAFAMRQANTYPRLCPFCSQALFSTRSAQTRRGCACRAGVGGSFASMGAWRLQMNYDFFGAQTGAQPRESANSGPFPPFPARCPLTTKLYLRSQAPPRARRRRVVMTDDSPR